MKNFILFLIFSTCYMISKLDAAGYEEIGSESFVEKCAEQIIEDRIYLKPGCIFVSAKDIFIKVDGNIVSVEAVYCDENGIYIFDTQLSLIYCYECGRKYNPQTDSVLCPHYPRPKR